MTISKSATAKSWFIALIPLQFVFLWSTGFIGAKFTVAYSDPFWLLFLRGFFSCITFSIIALILKSKWPSWSTVKKQMMAGFMLQAMFLGGAFKAISLSMPATFVSLVTGLQPILTALIISRKGTNLSRLQWGGIIVGFAGVFLVLSPFSADTTNVSLDAFLLSITALLGITLGTLYQKSFTSDGSLITQILFQYLSLTLVMGALSLVYEDQSVQWSLSFVLGLGWLVVGLSLSATMLLMYMIKHGEATKVSSYFYLVPSFIAVESWLLFQESITLQAFLGMILTMIGLVMFSLKKQ
ncbi:DMT family transporter [Vibrio sp. 1CM24A]|uniref:DMT family transporter n=1 Tax=Vibrio sp. 1CM24A TaxID=2929165 RepID=UPI0020BD626B|nr:DMT family transporter [Vibrio sp. 1CM24A]MCK8083678.1 DMT family transporter [Vibrio sp. 1CM24A]